MSPAARTRRTGPSVSVSWPDSTQTSWAMNAYAAAGYGTRACGGSVTSVTAAGNPAVEICLRR